MEGQRCDERIAIHDGGFILTVRCRKKAEHADKHEGDYYGGQEPENISFRWQDGERKREILRHGNPFGGW